MDENELISAQDSAKIILVNDASVDDKKIVKCLNCGTEFKGNFCPECGQSADTGRFTVKFIFQNLLKAILSNDGGILFTLKKIFLSPGQMVLDMINGKRKSYFSPFPMLFLILGLYILVFSYTGSNSIDVDVNDTPNLDVSSGMSDSDAVVVSGVVTELIDLFNRILGFYFDNYTMVIILTIPIYVFVVRLCLGKEFRKKFNVGETFIPVVYSLVPVIIYETVCSIVFVFSRHLFDILDNWVFVVHVVFLSMFFNKLIGFNKIKTVWRCTLSLVLYNFIVFFIIVLLIFIIVVVYIDDISEVVGIIMQ
ncbi:MAG: DUF3667 domain-containing protein [Candidatus Limimorpha sp.]